ncbi:probable E3 ubiquitin-protein ligase TRIML1 [Plectropomus leopardus]|uniref:probable E3 ubiquitin-protein ligase TRIML1 n=1 Tax=Plectropomus leopardus TaxID=160734 RepID=UPI001C4AA1EF|nr:probable E3 ubiquitin-protein ligase TRIML1 [Plectropomus leopardus]XP_042342101.1 probable E3 ubiquitin-protein ligase TRIML1 [Plectropomus leopardus]
MCVQPFLQETLENHQECLKKQRDAVKYRLKKLAARQSEITKKSSVIRENIIRKYQEIQAVLDEDLRITLSHLEMEERAAVCALDGLMERNCSLIQEIEQDLARLTVAMEQTDTEPDTMSFFSYPEQQDMETVDRVMDLLNRTDPSSVSLDEVKADQILSLANNMLLLISSQTPIIKKLAKSYSSEVSLDPDTAHPKLIISPEGDSAIYTDTWQQLPDLPGRFDTTLNVISLQGFSFGRHYWEIDVTGKTYWELGVTHPNLPRKGTTEDCWLGRGDESWCVEFFDGEYTAWHGGVPHQLPFTKRFCRIGVMCSFPAGLVTFLEADNMTPLFSFCAGTFSDCLHLALCPGHDHNGNNAEPVVICNDPSPTSDL